MMKLDPSDAWSSRGYGQGVIEPGDRPAVLVVDLQYAFTDPAYQLGGAPLIQRAIENAARLLMVARRVGVPVFHSVSAWKSEKEIGLWTLKQPFLAEITPDSRWAQVDERVWDPSDWLLPKKWPSLFHGTSLHSHLTAHQRDTVIIAGVTTSGCVRATVVDAFSNGFRALLPEDCVGDQGQDAHESNLRDIQRRYAEVVTADEVIRYLERRSDEEPFVQVTDPSVEIGHARPQEP